MSDLPSPAVAGFAKAGLRWTASLVEERLVEAADTLKRLPDVRVQGYFSTWPSVIRDFWEGFGWHEVRVRPGPPSPAAIDRMDQTLAWLRWVEPDDARIVWMRATVERWKSRGVREMSRQGNIEIGQRYVGTGPTLVGTPSRIIWFVGAIRRAMDGLLHADLISEKDPGRKKTISTEALADPTLYRPVAGEPQDL